MSNTHINTRDTRTDSLRHAYDQYLRRGLQERELCDVSMDGMGYLLPQRLEARLVNAMNTSACCVPCAPR